jgi:hypothetical protein
MVYIAASFYYEVYNVTVDQHTKFGYTAWYDRRAEIVYQSGGAAHVLCLRCSGVVLIRVDAGETTYLVHEIILSPLFDPITGTRVTLRAGYPMFLDATELAAKAIPTYIKGNFEFANGLLKDAITLVGERQ